MDKNLKLTNNLVSANCTLLADLMLQAVQAAGRGAPATFLRAGRCPPLSPIITPQGKYYLEEYLITKIFYVKAKATHDGQCCDRCGYVEDSRPLLLQSILHYPLREDLIENVEPGDTAIIVIGL